MLKVSRKFQINFFLDFFFSELEIEGKTERVKLEKEKHVLGKLLIFSYGKYLLDSITTEVWPFILEIFTNLRATIFIEFTLTKICFH